MTIEEAIKRCENIRDGAFAVLDSGFGTNDNENPLVYKKRVEFANICIAALRAQQERENPQPLTLEELRRMDGEVVYIPESEEYFGGMGIVSVSQERVVDVGVPKFGYWLFREYGEGWRAYRSQRNLLIPTMERRKESDRE